MLVSVVIPFRDLSNDLIIACIESVARQTIPSTDFELVLVAHGGDSSQLEFLSDFIDNNFSTLRWVLVRNGDLAGTLNSSRRLGAESSGGEFVYFLDGDDMITSDCLEQLTKAAYAGQEAADLVFGAKYRLSFEGVGLVTLSHRARKFDGSILDFPNQLLQSVSMCNVLIRRECLSGVFDIEEAFHEDACEYPRLLQNASVVRSIGIPTYFYREREGSITQSEMSQGHVSGILNAHDEFQAFVEATSEEKWAKSAANFLERLSRIFLTRSLRLGGINKELVHSWAEGVKSKGFWANRLDVADLADQILLQEDEADIESLIKANGIVPLASRQPESSFIPWTESSRLGDILHGKIAILCFADYHVEQARELSKGREEIICVDLSEALANGTRKYLGDFERIILDKSDIPLGRYDLSTAKIVITFNDTSPVIREALEYRIMRGFPLVGFVEGVIDFNRILDSRNNFPKWKKSGIPYRKNKKLFANYKFLKNQVPGTEIVFIGDSLDISLAKIRRREPKRFASIEKPVLVNLNFTYGVEEHRAVDFLRITSQACEAVGADMIISRHPMDRTDLGELGALVSEETFSQLFEKCDVMISRFSGLVPKGLLRGLEVIYVKAEEDNLGQLLPLADHLHVAENLTEIESVLRKISLGYRKNKTDFLDVPNELIDYDEKLLPRERFLMALDDLKAEKSEELIRHLNFYLGFPKPKSKRSRALATKQLTYLDLVYESISRRPVLLRIARLLKPLVGGTVDRIRHRATH